MKMSWRDLSFVDPDDGAPLSPIGDELVSVSGRRYGLIEGQPNLLPPGGLELGGWRFPAIEVVGFVSHLAIA